MVDLTKPLRDPLHDGAQLLALNWSKGKLATSPLEGDHTLSIILSKAFLLADDKKITHPTITSQIGRS